jgi:hypothetical protein
VQQVSRTLLRDYGQLSPPLPADFWGSGRLERVEKPTRDPGDVFDCRIESGLIRPGWFVEAADLPDKLQRCSPNLFLCGWRIKVEECPNVSTHPALPPLAGENYSTQALCYFSPFFLFFLA